MPSSELKTNVMKNEIFGCSVSEFDLEQVILIGLIQEIGYIYCEIEVEVTFELKPSILTAKQFFPGFFTFIFFLFHFSRPEHNCYAKFTSCST